MALQPLIALFSPVKWKERVKVQCQGFFCMENWGSYLLKLSELCESMNSCQDFQLLFLTLQADKTLQVFFWHLKNSLAAKHVNYEGKIKVFKKLLLSYISFLSTKILGEKKKLSWNLISYKISFFLEKSNTASLVQDYLSLVLSFL